MVAIGQGMAREKNYSKSGESQDISFYFELEKIDILKKSQGKCVKTLCSIYCELKRSQAVRIELYLPPLHDQTF